MTACSASGAGVVLTMLADTMGQEAFEDASSTVGVATVLGNASGALTVV